MFEDDCTLNDAGVVNIVAALQALRGVQWDIVRLGRSDADPLGPVADDGEEVARFSAVVADNDCSDSRTGLKLMMRKRPSSPGVLHSDFRLVDRGLPALAALSCASCALRTGAGHYERRRLSVCVLSRPLRRDLIHSPPVQSVRLQGPFVSLAIASSLQRAVFGVDMTAASKRGDCFCFCPHTTEISSLLFSTARSCQPQ